jgi:sterol desaturase/sphingolipid hydroxylase (fatty acid hydroxylase superfamily)
MRLSKAAYYTDFAIYAIVIVALTFAATRNADWISLRVWLEAFIAGALVWTLLEYLLHRFLLHRQSPFATMHAVHHAEPRAFVGTPTWLTLGVLWVSFFLPEWWLGSLNLAGGLVAGVMTGFLWYGVVHHVIHHGRPRVLRTALSKCANRHRRHHYASHPGNFGVTTPLWDHLFGTVIDGRLASRDPGVDALAGRRRSPSGSSRLY